MRIDGIGRLPVVDLLRRMMPNHCLLLDSDPTHPEIVRLPARHDIDVERGTRGTVCDRREPANQHIGDSVPVEKTHE